MSKKFDENREKPATHKQWHERSEYAVLTKAMTQREIELLREVLAKSYKAAIEDVTYDVERITNEEDDDRDDCVWLLFKLKCFDKGVPVLRTIYHIKQPVPERIKRAAEEARRQQATFVRRRAGQSLQPITWEPDIKPADPTCVVTCIEEVVEQLAITDGSADNPEVQKIIDELPRVSTPKRRGKK